MDRMSVTVLLIPVAAVVGAIALGGQTPSASDITVHEGTSMAVALSPDKGTLVLDLQGSLWTLPIAGGNAKRITDEYNDARQPAWSPDGKRIAYQGYRDGTWRIWTVAPDGSDAKAMTSGPFDDREPHWSPDGGRIAFSSDRSGNYDVWVLDVASGQVRQITKDPANDFFPTWSPDGREIAFVSTRTPSPGLYATTVDGSERLMATAAGSIGSPSWSPDGNQVLFSVLPAGGFNPVGDTHLMLGTQTIASNEDYFPFRAQWLSGDEFLYPADGKIKRRSLKGGPASAVKFSATLRVTPASYTKKKRDFDSADLQPVKGIMRPVVSPDGRQLAFAALGDIWTMPIAGGAPKRLTDDAFIDTDPAWSPDGSKIAFSSDRAGGMDIWVRDLRTGSDRRVSSLPNADMSAAWSPDGKWIIAKSRMTITPTVALGGYNAAVAGDPSIKNDPRMKALQPAWVQGSGGVRGADVPQAPDPQALHKFMERSSKMLIDLLHAGVPIIAGVDAPLVPYGAALHTELAGFVEAGFTPFQALQTATTNTATLLNAQSDLGTIEPGKLADLVIVEGNPLTNIRDTSRVRKVIKNGEVFTIEELLKVPNGARSTAATR